MFPPLRIIRQYRDRGARIVTTIVFAMRISHQGDHDQRVLFSRKLPITNKLN